jgi:hypothetical protein
VLKISTSGSSNDMSRALARLAKMEVNGILAKYGQAGVNALAAATPQESGLTAQSWSYSIERSHGKVSLVFLNSHVDSEGQPIAILIQYGHVTGTGGYVRGRDYINPQLRPIFDKIANEIWREVKK